MSGRGNAKAWWFMPTCSTGKRGYVSRRDAKAARQSSPQDGGKLNAYHCAECDTWHLGRLPPSVTRGYSSRPGA